jgi:hypothetical protein
VEQTHRFPQGQRWRRSRFCRNSGHRQRNFRPLGGAAAPFVMRQ